MSIPESSDPSRLRRLRIVNITEDARSAGPQRRIVLVAEALATSHEIKTVVLHPRRNATRLVQELRRHGVRNYGLPSLTCPAIGNIFSKPWFYSHGRPPAFFLRNEKFDIVHCNSSWQWKGAIAAKLAGIPVILHLNDTNTPRLVKMVFHVVARYCASTFIVEGERVKSYYLSSRVLGAKQAYTIQAPVRCRKPSGVARTPPSELSPTGALRTITLANINPAKDIGTLIRTSPH